MRKEFGTSNVENYSKKELLEESKKLIPDLFCFNQKGHIKPNNYEKIIRLFEIIKFGKEKYPFLLTLKFDQNKLMSEVNIWKDPHYNDSETALTGFAGNVIGFPDIYSLSRNQEILKNAFDHFLLETNDSNVLENTICVAGNKDSILNMGRASKSFFGRKNKCPIFTSKEGNRL